MHWLWVGVVGAMLVILSVVCANDKSCSGGTIE